MIDNNTPKKLYGLFTSIALIIGIVIGSGIFFKSDNILIATNGSVSLGIIIFCFAAVSIIFGSLTVAELASRTDEPGGIFTYARLFLGQAAGSAYGWFYTFVYLSTITVVLSWVSGIYFCIFFNIEGTLETQCLVGFLLMTTLYVVNILSAKVAGYFQNAATVIKLIPLLIIAIAGLFQGGSETYFSQTAISQLGGSSWILAIPAIAFSFDGWIISTTVAHQIKNSKRNLPIALIISPLFILIVYILYFIGISTLVGPDTIMSMGDAHLDYAANLIFGAFGAKLIGLFVLISVLGGLNGLIIGISQMPYSLALQQMIPGSEKIKKLAEKTSFPLNSSIASYFIILIWYIVHYFTQRFMLLTNSDVSEIAIVVSYLLYLPLYYQVFKMGIKKEIGTFRGIICPILATIGSLIIFSGGLQNSLFLLYIAICLVFLIGGYIYYRKVTQSQIKIKS
ncbi:MAG: APC family permease [Eubacterium sp.]